ncbi:MULTISPECIES: CopG family transcriptional regulator [unclassified Microcoleus]|uniref:ribbon-helix-helix domain-containing protein n=1 Tax=unclassified Microcoleus TaxID=2642155 RepID=UPI0025F5C0ED|nr:MULTISPECIES: CopG family transcriptional regulator [unclassified Microcoleus]
MAAKNLTRVTTYVNPEIAKALEEWAEKDERSVSWLAGKLIEKGVKEYQSQEQQQASTPEVKE